MHLIFFDEVKPQPEYPFYHLGAIGIEEKYLKEIETEVNTLANQVFGELVLKKETEFRAHNIYHRKDQFKKIQDVQIRIDTMISLVKILSRPRVHLIDVQINTDKLYNSIYAGDYAFMFLCEKADSLMQKEKSLGVLIGDRENDSVTNRYSVALSQYRSAGTEYDYRKQIDYLFESVHFTPSHLSRFLQLADIYSWICQFKNKYKKERDSPKFKRFFDQLKEINLFPSKWKEWPSKKS
jgi:hypothetical protein